jgi:hypothetical protein
MGMGFDVEIHEPIPTLVLPLKRRKVMLIPARCKNVDGVED